MKRTVKKAPPNRVMREFTPEERARWKRAAAEAERPEAKAAGRRVKQAFEAGRGALRDAFRLLREERERQGLSLADMQERTEIERSTLSRLENAEEPNPTVGTLTRIAHALGKSITVQLVDRTDK